MEQKKRDGLSEEQRKKSLSYSIKDGSAYAVMDSVGNGYVSPFALALGANNAFIGFLASLPGLVTSLFQLKTPRLMERYSRKSLVVSNALFQAFMWLPLVIISLLYFRLGNPLLLLLVFYVVLVSFNAAIGPAWASWMRDLVPVDESGRFFGRRNLIVGFIGLVAMLLAGFVLDFFKEFNLVFIGFALLFATAFIARLASRYFLSKKYEPRFKLQDRYYFTFAQFAKGMLFNNFGRFVLYTGMFQFAVQLASPFFTVYMLKNLGFSYVTFTFLVTVQSFASLIAMPFWGRFSDKYGNLRTLRIGGFLIPLIPVIWLFSSNIYYLAFVQLFSGVIWAAFNLSASNFIYCAVSRERMGLCVAYSNIFNTIGVFVGATMGGFLSTRISYLFPAITSLAGLFILSAVMRFIVSLGLLSSIQEVMKVKRFDLRASIRHEINAIMNIKA